MAAVIPQMMENSVITGHISSYSTKSSALSAFHILISCVFVDGSHNNAFTDDAIEKVLNQYSEWLSDLIRLNNFTLKELSNPPNAF